MKVIYFVAYQEMAKLNLFQSVHENKQNTFS